MFPSGHHRALLLHVHGFNVHVAHVHDGSPLPGLLELDKLSANEVDHVQ